MEVCIGSSYWIDEILRVRIEELCGVSVTSVMKVSEQLIITRYLTVHSSAYMILSLNLLQ